jgi:hypothetical protein
MSIVDRLRTGLILSPYSRYSRYSSGAFVHQVL